MSTPATRATTAQPQAHSSDAASLSAATTTESGPPKPPGRSPSKVVGFQNNLVIVSDESASPENSTSMCDNSVSSKASTQPEYVPAADSEKKVGEERALHRSAPSLIQKKTQLSLMEIAYIQKAFQVYDFVRSESTKDVFAQGKKRKGGNKRGQQQQQLRPEHPIQSRATPKKASKPHGRGQNAPLHSDSGSDSDEDAASTNARVQAEVGIASLEASEKESRSAFYQMFGVMSEGANEYEYLNDNDDSPAPQDDETRRRARRSTAELKAEIESKNHVFEADYPPDEVGLVKTASEQLLMFPPLSNVRVILDAEIQKMEEYERYAAALRQEKKQEEQHSSTVTGGGDALSATISRKDKSQRGERQTDSTILSMASSRGVPFSYFAMVIVAPFFNSFFALPDAPTSQRKEEKNGSEKGKKETATSAGKEGEEEEATAVAFDPHLYAHVSAVQQLFFSMDGNNDSRVSWSDFSELVMQEGEKFLLDHGMQEHLLQDTLPGLGLTYPLHFRSMPTNRNVWQATYPLVHYLYHVEPFHKFIRSQRSRHYFTGSVDGLVKLWRPDAQLSDSQSHTSIVHERNLLSVPSPITDMALSPLSLGDSEVVAVSAMDGTISLIRANSGEVVRTMLGVRSSTQDQVAALKDIYLHRAGGVDRQEQVFEAKDLLSLRQRAPTVSGTVLRQPYAVPAYRDEALEIFFGKVSKYFKAVDVLPPTYAHLKKPVTSSSDILYNFGAEHLTEAAYRHRQRADPKDSAAAPAKSWFATALALAYVPPTPGSYFAVQGGAYLLLGFETGALQAYQLNPDWFSITHLNATRMETPKGHQPAYSTVLHEATITQIIISESADLMMTISDDGTVGVRAVSRIEVPLMTLGSGVVRPLDTTGSRALTGALSQHNVGSGGDTTGHTSRIMAACWSDKNHLLATGGMDYCVYLWTPRATSRPYRRLDLREMQRAYEELAHLGACGYPVDVSFMERHEDPLRLLVLDSRRITRIIKALTGELLGVLSDDSPASLALGDMLMIGYEPIEDRLLLGGRCVRVWELEEVDEHAKDYFGHRKPVLFLSWHHRLNVYVTADESHVVLWKVQVAVNEAAVARRAARRVMRQKLRAAEAAKIKNRLKAMDAQLRGGGGGAEEQAPAHAAGLPFASSSATSAAPTAAAAGEDLELSLSSNPPGCGGVAHRHSTSGTSKRLGGPAGGGEGDDGEEEVDDGADEAPTLNPTLCADNNFFNHTYWTMQHYIAYNFAVDEGVRSVTMDPHAAQAYVFVSLLHVRAIVQYNALNGAKLRRFQFPELAQDVHGFCIGEALLNRSTIFPTSLLCAAYEQDPTSGYAAMYPIMMETPGGGKDGDAQQQQKRDTEEIQASLARQEEERADKTSTAAADKKKKKAALFLHGAEGTAAAGEDEMRGDPPHRLLTAKNTPVTSVLVVSALSMLVYGGIDRLYVSTLKESSTFAKTFQLLTDHAEEENKSSGAAATTKRPGNTTANNNLFMYYHMTKVKEILGRVPLHLIALFPGRLVTDPSFVLHRLQSTGSGFPPTAGGGGFLREKSTTVKIADARSSSIGGTQSPSQQQQQQSAATAEEKNTAEQSEPTAENYFAEAQASTSGHIGHLLLVPNTKILISGNNVGLVQFWDLENLIEIFRFSVTLGRDTITCMSLSSDLWGSQDNHGAAEDEADKRPLYLCVGDQYGYITVLDLTHIPFSQIEEVLLPNPKTTAESEDDAAFVRNEQHQIGELFRRHLIVLDRWRGHKEDVRGLQFAPLSTVMGSADDLAKAESSYMDVAYTTPRHIALHELVADAAMQWNYNVSSCDISLSQRQQESGRDDKSGGGGGGGGGGSVEGALTEHKKRPRDAYLSPLEQVRRSLLQARPITLFSCGEDHSVLVWRWQQGTLQCVCSLGAGLETKVSPPLMQPAHMCMLLYETARRLYVLQRLVDELRFFYVTRANAGAFLKNVSANRDDANELNLITFFSHEELSRALDFMEWEVQELQRQDPAHVLATWGSLAWRSLPSEGSMINWQHRWAAQELAATAALYDEDEAAVAAMRKKGAGKGRRAAPPAAASSSTRNYYYGDDGGAKKKVSCFDMAGLTGEFDWLGDAVVMPDLPSYMSRAPIRLALLTTGKATAAAGATSNEHSAVLSAAPAESRRSSAKDMMSGTNLTDYSMMLETSTSGGALGGADNNAASVRVPAPTRPAQLDRQQWRLSSYSPYVFAFMGGVYMDMDVRDALRRTVDCLREDIMKFWSAGGQFGGRGRLGRTFSQMNSAVNRNARTGGATATANTTTATTDVAPGDVAPTPTAVSSVPTKGLLQPSSMGINAAATGEGATITLPVPVPIPTPRQTSLSASAPSAPSLQGRRSSRNPLRYKVSLGSHSQLVHRKTDPPTAPDEEDEQDDTPKEAGPRIIAKPFRQQVAEGSVAASKSYDQKRKGAMLRQQHRAMLGVTGSDDGNNEDNDDDDDDETRPSTASAIMQEAYKERRKEEAMQKLAQLQQHDLASRVAEAGGPRSEQRKLMLAAGLVHGLADYDEFFASTNTRSVFFGKEKQLYLDEEYQKRRQVRHISHNFRDIVAPEEGESELDWYARRDREHRQKKREDTLWNPSNVMVTLMDWEAPRIASAPPELQAATEGRKGSEEAATATPPAPAQPKLAVPSMLPMTLNASTASGHDLAVPVPTFEFKTRKEKEQQDAKQRRAAPAELAAEVDEMKLRMRAAVQQREMIMSTRGANSTGGDGGGTSTASNFNVSTSSTGSGPGASPAAAATTRSPQRTFPKATRYTNNQK